MSVEQCLCGTVQPGRVDAVEFECELDGVRVDCVFGVAGVEEQSGLQR